MCYCMSEVVKMCRCGWSRLLKSVSLPRGFENRQDLCHVGPRRVLLVCECSPAEFAAVDSDCRRMIRRMSDTGLAGRCRRRCPGQTTDSGSQGFRHQVAGVVVRRVVSTDEELSRLMRWQSSCSTTVNELRSMRLQGCRFIDRALKFSAS
jgi:hypothetical protein